MTTDTPATTPEVGIQQLNLSYIAEQDRLLFRVGLSDNQELQLWLTLRISRQIWQLLGEKNAFPSANTPANATPAEAVERFTQELEAAESLKKMDFETEYQARESLDAAGPMLVTRLELAEAGQAQTLHLTCLEGRVVNMNLNPQMALAICNMLQMASKEANWDIGAPAAAQAASSLVMPANQVVH